MKKVLVVSFLLVLALILFKMYSHGKWDKYYENKRNEPPRELIVKALNLFEIKGQAIDLGCGVGNEAILLLNNGWEVYAIDSEPLAIQILKEQSSSEKLKIVLAKFDKKATWNLLPQVDFIYASFSLPYCKPKKFKETWQQIKLKIKPQGRFAGHFFGKRYIGFSEKEKKQMIFFTKEELLDLFQDFELEYFEEKEQERISGTGKPIHSHVYEVIARKKKS